MSIQEFKSSTPVTQRTGKHFSGQVSYCRHTHIAIVLTNSFQFGRTRGEFIKSEHPVFGAGQKWLESTYLEMQRHECGTLTEKYLLVTALLRTYGLLDTDHCGLHLESSQFHPVWDAFHNLMLVWGNTLRAGKFPATLATYNVSASNASDGKALARYLKLVSAELSEHSDLREQLPTGRRLTLNDEIELEQELKKILNSNSGKYKEKHGRAATNELRLAKELAKDDLAIIEYYIFQTNLDKLRTEALKKVIELCRVHLAFDEDGSRTRNLLVVRHLEAKLETILNIEKDAGFILLDFEEGRGNSIKYNTRTKVQELSKVQVIDVPRTNSLGETLDFRTRMELRRKAKAAQAAQAEDTAPATPPTKEPVL